MFIENIDLKECGTPDGSNIINVILFFELPSASADEKIEI